MLVAGYGTRLIRALSYFLTFNLSRMKLLGFLPQADRLLRRLLCRRPKLYEWLTTVASRVGCTGKAFFSNNLPDQVSSLSFSTLFALVPLAAVLLAIARGFGFGNYLEEQFREFMVSQPKAADYILQYANNYLTNNQSYAILGVGFLFIVYSVVNLFRNIESTFNIIWKAKQSRSLWRMLIDYTALTLIFTVAIILTAGITVYVGGLANAFWSNLHLQPAVRVGGFLFQLLALWAAFVFFYTFMPYVRVPLRCAVGPAFLAALLLLLFQYLYAYVQFFLSSYDAVYGSLAILPLFMLSVMVAWAICLFGAELTFVNQAGVDWRHFDVEARDLKWCDFCSAMLLLLALITKANREDSHPRLHDLSEESGIPSRLTSEMLDQLESIGLVHRVVSEYSQGGARYSVDLKTSEMNISELVGMLEHRLGKSIHTPRFRAYVTRDGLKALRHVDFGSLCETMNEKVVSLVDDI